MTGRYQHQIEPEFSRIHADEEFPWLTASREATVLVVVGPPYGGKTTVARLLSQLLPAPLVPGRDPARVGSLFAGILGAANLSRRDGTRRSASVVVDDLVKEEDFSSAVAFFRPRPTLFRVNAGQDSIWERASRLAPNRWTRETLAELTDRRELLGDNLSKLTSGLGAVYLNGDGSLLEISTAIQSALHAMRLN